MFIEKRRDQRFYFFADAEVTLGDGTFVPAQLAELSSRGCYIGTFLPIPVGTECRILISDGMTTCEIGATIIYLHSSSGLGIFGMGLQFEKSDGDDCKAMEAWLQELANKRAYCESGR
jgi:hypothetical protein